MDPEDFDPKTFFKFHGMCGVLYVPLCKHVCRPHNVFGDLSVFCKIICCGYSFVVSIEHPKHCVKEKY